MIEAAAGPGNLFWLASYPKSGNTWMRILLTNYLRDADEPADINNLDGGPIASARAIFDDNVGIEASDLTQDEIELLRPRVYEMISDQVTEARAENANDDPPPPFLKVHDAYTLTTAGVPLISKAATSGAIYLLRNPLDVVESFAHHSAQSSEYIVKNMASADFAFVDKPKRLHNQLRQRLLTWSQHVTSWVDEPGLPVHVVRYEDLSANTESVFAGVLRFAGFTPDPDRVAKAVDFSSFDRVQAQETEAGFGEKMPGAKSFFRKGIVGSWSGTLTADLAAQVCRDHHAVMDRFGYEPDQVLKTLEE